MKSTPVVKDMKDFDKNAFLDLETKYFATSAQNGDCLTRFLEAEADLRL